MKEMRKIKAKDEKKNIRRFLGILLCFALLLTSFGSSFVYASETDEAISINFATIASNPNAEKIASNSSPEVYVYKISSSVPMTGDTKVKITGTYHYSVTIIRFL